MRTIRIAVCDDDERERKKAILYLYYRILSLLLRRGSIKNRGLNDSEKWRWISMPLMIVRYPGARLLAEEYSSGEALLAAGKKYDILLLDIDMEGLDGIETARRIREADKGIST